MTDRSEYFERAETWATDTRELSTRSRRTAWIVAGIAVAVAALEAVALAMLAPLKTVQPVTLLVDKQTGYVQALDPLSPRRITADDALTDSLLAQYVSAREGFDRATVGVAYRRVALWSSGTARQIYVSQMPASNPASPFQRYAPGTIVQASVKSVSKLSAGTALVRFDTAVADRSGRVAQAQPWIAVVRYRYSDAPMQFEDRLVNPLGFQVLSYRRDAEAPSALPQPVSAMTMPGEPAIATPPVVVPRTSQTVVPPLTARPTATPQSARRLFGSPGRAEPVYPQRPTSERREVPLNNFPMGSPLSSNGPAVSPTVVSAVP